MKKTYNIIFIIFIIHSSLFFNHCMSQWIQQTLPISAEASSLVFFDVNTGVISVAQGYVRYILRTTNSGYNWNIVNSLTGSGISVLQKIDSTTIYAGGGNNGYLAIYRTYNRGLNWDSVSKTSSLSYAGFYFVNSDTGWISVYDWTTSKIYRTTNGGVTFLSYSNPSSLLYGRLFFLKEKINGEYYGWLASSGNGILKTTNSGLYWSYVSTLQVEYGSELCFINKDTGWVTNVYTNALNPQDIYISYNGGQNWVKQNLPGGSIFSIIGITSIKSVSKNTIYGVGGALDINHQRVLPVIWKTTNAGNNWGYQKPDTSLHSGPFKAIDFVNEDTGWVYSGPAGLFTTNGGGQIIYTVINGINISFSNKFKLYQNYPNPFNSVTKIKYQIPTATTSYYTNIILKVYDISGKEIKNLVNEKKLPGTYEVKFDADGLSSGVYFYLMQINGLKADIKKMIFLK